MKMEKWSVDEVCNWLVQTNLGELVPKFHEEEVSGAALLALNDRMIQQLVKKIGHQAVLMDLIAKCRQQTRGSGFTCESPSSLLPEAMGRTTTLQLAEEQVNYLASTESLVDGSVDQRVLKQKKNVRHVLARCKALQWTNSYILPEFPYDVKCILAERKCPDHSMRIRIIEFLQADMTKYLEGSLYPTTQQYNDVINALLQTYPFLDEDECGFVENIYKKEFESDVEISEHINWFNEEYKKTERNWVEVDNRMSKTLEIRRKMLFREFQSLTHKDICKKTAEILEKYSDNILSSYLVKNNPISVTLQKRLKQHMEDDIMKFMKMTATCLLLPVIFGEDSFLFATVNEEVKVSTPMLEVKYPFNVNLCEFSLFVEKEKLAQLNDCPMPLTVLLATYHIFCIPFPEMLYNTLTFLESLIFEVKCPRPLFVKYKRTQKYQQPKS